MAGSALQGQVAAGERPRYAFRQVLPLSPRRAVGEALGSLHSWDGVRLNQGVVTNGWEEPWKAGSLKSLG